MAFRFEGYTHGSYVLEGSRYEYDTIDEARRVYLGIDDEEDETPEND